MINKQKKDKKKKKKMIINRFNNEKMNKNLPIYIWQKQNNYKNK